MGKKDTIVIDEKGELLYHPKGRLGLAIYGFRKFPPDLRGNIPAQILGAVLAVTFFPLILVFGFLAGTLGFGIIGLSLFAIIRKAVKASEKQEK